MVPGESQHAHRQGDPTPPFPPPLRPHTAARPPQVPYLVYGGDQLQPGDAPLPPLLQLPESLAILEFLADLLPEARLLPADPIARARARFFAQMVDTKLVPAFVGVAFMGAPVEGLFAAIGALQAMLPAEGGWVCGERWSIADAMFMPFVMRIEVMLEQNLPTMAPGVAERALEVLRSERFARFQQYKKDTVARPSMMKTWDEVHSLVYHMMYSG